MICPTNAQGFYGEQWGLLTAIVLGFMFGFSLERSGFGNARKLAAQFYGYDMTVFKVMFTAVLVAMVGLYAAVAFGFMDLSLLWINPTYMWAQLIGGFMLGIGFAVSGLCPGTAVVATASGRMDGLVTVGGAFAGTAIFATMIDRIPVVETLYSAGFQGRSLLHDLVGIGAPWLALIVVVVALGAFIGAEALERRFGKRFAPVPLTPVGGGKVKFYLVGVLALVAIGSGLAPAPQPEAIAPLSAAAYEPMDLAEALINGNPNLMMIDLRSASERETGAIPGSQPGSLSGADSLLAERVDYAAVGTRVLFIDSGGSAPSLPSSWPSDREYRYLRGGFEAWQNEVLQSAESSGTGSDEKALAARREQISAFFSGAEAKAPSSAPPPPLPTGNRKGKKKADGGC